MDILAGKIKGILKEMQEEQIQKKFPGLLSEAIHKKLQDIMDSPEIEAKDKMNFVSGAARQLIASGEESGLENAEARQGSSRAVFFPKEPKSINLDGHDVHTNSVVKIAFPGYLDKYNKSGKLLGEHQNEVESNRSINNEHSVIHQDESGNWHTNPNGVLPPHFGHHPEHHYLEMGRVQTLNNVGDQEFKNATKTESHPEGLTHRQFEFAVNTNWQAAHGHDTSTAMKGSVKHWMEHPLVKNVTDLVANTDINPGDFSEDNMGLWKHPITGKKHVVISDFGYSNEVARHYLNARNNKEGIDNEDY